MHVWIAFGSISSFDEQLVLICFVMKTYWDNKVPWLLNWLKETSSTSNRCIMFVCCCCFFAQKKNNEWNKSNTDRNGEQGKKIEASCNIYLAQRQMHSTPLSHCTEESVLAHALRISRLNASNYALLRDQMCSTPCTGRLSATMQLNCKCCFFDCKRHATPHHAMPPPTNENR